MRLLKNIHLLLYLFWFGLLHFTFDFAMPKITWLDRDGHDGMNLRVGEVWCQRSGWERCPGGWGKEHPLILAMRKYYGFRDTNTAGTVLANMIWPNSKSFHLALQRLNVGQIAPHLKMSQSQSEDPTTACYPAGDPPQPCSIQPILKKWIFCLNKYSGF